MTPRCCIMPISRERGKAATPLHMAEKRWMAAISEDQQQTLLDMLTAVQANAPRPEDI